MENVYIVTVKYKDDRNDHSKIDEIWYPSVQQANAAAWELFDQYLDDLVEYWDKRGDADKTNRYSKFIRELKELKIKTDADEHYAKNNTQCRTFFSNIGGGKLRVAVKLLKEAV